MPAGHWHRMGLTILVTLVMKAVRFSKVLLLKTCYLNMNTKFFVNLILSNNHLAVAAKTMAICMIVSSGVVVWIRLDDNGMIVQLKCFCVRWCSSLFRVTVYDMHIVQYLNHTAMGWYMKLHCTQSICKTILWRRSLISYFTYNSDNG